MPLDQAVKEHISKLQDHEFQLSASEHAEEIAPITRSLHGTRRKLEAAYHDHLKQGDRVPVKPFVLECPECHQQAPSMDWLYLHLRKVHNYPEEDAAAGSTTARAEYDADITTLRRLMGKHTEILLEEDPEQFQTPSEE